MYDIRLRNSTEDDLLLVYDWANDNTARKNYFNTNCISLEEHKQWFANALNSEDIHLFIFETSDTKTPIGQLRIDYLGVISISIDKKFRGKNLGSKMLAKAIKYIEQKPIYPTLDHLVAYIKKENIPSIKIFEKVGFKLSGNKLIKGFPCLEYYYKLQR